jgi:hypothetical protein
MTDNLRPLTQEQRQGARKKAREAVIRAIGPKPAREHFNQATISEYPPSVTPHFLIVPGAAPGRLHAISDPLVGDWFADIRAGCI